jgi:hypothetical protein
MSDLITTKAELISYLTTKQIASKEPPKFVFVKTKVRADIMTDETQGTFIHKGRVMRFNFESVGGGVWKASISSRIGVYD